MENNNIQGTQFQNSQGAPVTPNAPHAQLKTNRSAIKTILLSLITFGIYGLVVYTHMADDVNLVCSRYDGKKTMNFLLLFFIVGPITFEIGTLVWFHKICGRIGDALKARNIDYNFSAGSFWLWNTLGTLILVGPFVFLHKMIKAVNLLNNDYNSKG